MNSGVVRTSRAAFVCVCFGEAGFAQAVRVCGSVRFVAEISKPIFVLLDKHSLASEFRAIILLSIFKNACHNT